MSTCQLLLTALLALSLAGCTQHPPTYKTRGTVSYQGKPLTTGVIALHHTNHTSPLVKGDIGADGTFQLMTYKPGDGAEPGEYTVTVTSMTPSHGIEGVDKDYRSPQPLIPLKYMRLAETPLKVTIEPRHDNVLSLSLTP